MNNRAKRRIVYILAAGLVFVMLLTIVMIKIATMRREPSLSTEEMWAENLNKQNLDVMFYGTAPIGPSNLKARQIQSLDEVEQSGSGFSGSLLIIYDVNNDLFIQPDEMTSVKEFYLKGGYIIYLGSSKYQLFYDAGFPVPGEGTNSCFYHRSESGNVALYGGFCDDAKHFYEDVEAKLSDFEKPAYAMLSELSWDPSKFFSEHVMEMTVLESHNVSVE